MAFQNFGTLKAAAKRIDFQGMIRNAVEQEQLTNAAIQQRKGEIQYYSEKMKTATSDISSVQTQLDEFNKGKMKEIGEFVAANPGFELNLEKMSKFNGMTGTLLNNSIIREGETSKQNFESFRQAYLNKELTNEEFVTISKQWEDYQRDGNGGQPFTFVPPKRYTVAQLQAIGSSMFETSRDFAKRGDYYGTETTYDPAEVMSTAQSIINDPEYSASIDLLFRKANGMHESKEKMMFELLKNSKETGFDVKGQDQMALQRAKNQYANQEIGEIRFMTDIWGPLSRGEHSPRLEVMGALTDAGGIGSIFNMADPNLHITVPLNDGSFMSIKDIGKGTKVIGGGYAFMHNGINYTTLDVSFEDSMDKAKYLETLGFKSKSEKEESAYGQNLSLTSTIRRNPTYTGTIVLPLKTSTVHLRNFDLASKGITAKQMQGRQMYYDYYGQQNFGQSPNTLVETTQEPYGKGRNAMINMLMGTPPASVGYPSGKQATKQKSTTTTKGGGKSLGY